MSTTDKQDHLPTPSAGVSRRQFITTAAGVGASVSIVPRHVLGRGFQAPSDLVNVAGVGVGGMGANNRYHGGFKPPAPPELGDHARLAESGGILYIGSKGKLLCNEGMPARLLPARLHNSFSTPPEVLPRVPHQQHEMNWIRAIKGEDTLSTPFSYAAHLHEIMLLGLVSLRAGSPIDYDAANQRVTNNADANQYLTREYRQPYSR